MNRFDVIGDVHGQFDKLVELLKHLGYSRTNVQPKGIATGVATDGVREATQSHAYGSPSSSERKDARTARPDGEVWRHPERTAIFVGDLISLNRERSNWIR